MDQSLSRWFSFAVSPLWLALILSLLQAAVYWKMAFDLGRRKRTEEEPATWLPLQPQLWLNEQSEDDLWLSVAGTVTVASLCRIGCVHTAWLLAGPMMFFGLGNALFHSYESSKFNRLHHRRSKTNPQLLG